MEDTCTNLVSKEPHPNSFESIKLTLTGFSPSPRNCTLELPDLVRTGDVSFVFYPALRRLLEIKTILHPASTYVICFVFLIYFIYWNFSMLSVHSVNNSSYCIRCFHVSIKSPNIVIVRTAGNPDRCFFSAPAAESSCPKAEFLDATRQMILYSKCNQLTSCIPLEVCACYWCTTRFLAN